MKNYFIKQDRVDRNWNTGERVEGIDHLRKFLLYFFNAFPDIFCSVEEIIGEANKVIVKVNYKGSHKGEFLGFPPSNNSINVSNAYLFYLEDGKIISSTSFTLVPKIGPYVSASFIKPIWNGCFKL